MYASALAQGLNTNQSLYSQLEQMNYSKWMMAKIDVTFTTLIELIVNTDIAQIGNQPASAMFQSNFESLVQIQKTITSGFFEQQQDGEYDPFIQSLLFGQACHYLTGFALSNCLKVQNDGQNLNYATLLSNLQYYMMIVHDKYLASDKTESTRQSLRLEAFGLPFSNLMAVNDLNQLISAQIIKNFENSVTTANRDSQVLLIVLTVILLVVIFLLWKSVFIKIREVDNQFKNVLRVFPPELILSNFLIKQYLKKTSKDSFNSILNNI